MRRRRTPFPALRDQVQKETLGLNTDVENAERARDAVNDQLGHDAITAPMDGVILDRYCNLGEFIPPQTQICRIGSAENQVVAQVNEEDVGYLTPGMKAQIRLYSQQDRDIVGTLKKNSPAGGETRFITSSSVWKIRPACFFRA